MNEPVVMLELLTGEKRGTRIRLAGASAVIGRASEADIVVAQAKGVSRRHAEVSVRDGAVWVRDLGSQNGTVVNDERVSERKLAHGERLSVGDVAFRVHIVPAEDLVPAKNRGGQAPAAKGRSARAPGPRRKDPEGAPTADRPQERTSSGRGTLARVVGLLVLIGCALYALYWTTHLPEQTSPEHYIIRQREKLVLILPRAAQGFTASDIHIQSERGDEVVRWEHFDGLIGEEDTKNVLVLEGSMQGRARVLVGPREDPYATYVVHVRGIIPREWPEDIPRDRALSLASQNLEQAEDLKRHQPYAALQRYRNARELLMIAGETTRGQEVTDRILDVRSDLRQRVSRLYSEARVAIKGSAGNPRDFDRGVELLSQIMQLVPDPRSVDWQLANLVQKEVERERLRSGRA